MDFSGLSEAERLQMLAVIEEKQRGQLEKLFFYLTDSCFSDCINDFTSKVLNGKEVGNAATLTCAAGIML